MSWIAAAWLRYDEWKLRRRDVAADVVAWFDQMRRQPSLPLGPREPSKRPGQRYVGKHRLVPDEPVRRT